MLFHNLDKECDINQFGSSTKDGTPKSDRHCC